MASADGRSTATVALEATCGLIGCTTAPHKTAAEWVEAALLADPNIYARHTDIEVDRGMVHLGGFVWDNDDFRIARRDAASVAGVTEIVTDMELDRGGIAGIGK